MSHPIRPIPLIVVTDLHHPPIDPDDHFDVATAYALPELEVLAVIIDAVAPDAAGCRPPEPGFLPISILNHITGRAVPVAAGP
jgi:hypothetical protein